ncbi:MAG: hypothetical protein MZU91_09285 [Desulfosudis oleivorans]|nr:hypothetical protein [Desulfosudis oleivorans]
MGCWRPGFNIQSGQDFRATGSIKAGESKAQDEHVKLTKEVEGLRDNTRQIEEKYAAEIIRLRQENEQLKNDIQQLKNLELQLEKREKMLR